MLWAFFKTTKICILLRQRKAFSHLGSGNHHKGEMCLGFVADDIMFGWSSAVTEEHGYFQNVQTGHISLPRLRVP